MAAIDYGALVFKNGEQIMQDKLFPVLEIGPVSIGCYKVWCNMKPVGANWDMVSIRGTQVSFLDETGKAIYCDDRDHKSIHEIFPIEYHIKELTPRVFRFRTSRNGDHYTIIYGYGIDNDPRVWNRVKHIYHNKRDAAIIDRQIERAGGFLKRM